MLSRLLQAFAGHHSLSQPSLSPPISPSQKFVLLAKKKLRFRIKIQLQAAGLNEFQSRDLLCLLECHNFKDLTCQLSHGRDGKKSQDMAFGNPKPENSIVISKRKRVIDSFLQALSPQEAIGELEVVSRSERPSLKAAWPRSRKGSLGSSITRHRCHRHPGPGSECRRPA